MILGGLENMIEETDASVLACAKLSHEDLLDAAREAEILNEPIHIAETDLHEDGLSAESKAMLDAGIASAKQGPNVYLGSFASYLDDDFES